MWGAGWCEGKPGVGHGGTKREGKGGGPEQGMGDPGCALGASQYSERGAATRGGGGRK